MADPTAHFRLAEHELGEDLTEFITSRREQDPPVSFNRIARDLYEATDGEIDVVGQTIWQWYQRFTEAMA